MSAKGTAAAQPALPPETPGASDTRATSTLAWRPWGGALFEQARAARKPVFFYVGARWSHYAERMENETLADPGIAAFLNERFLCARVDADERPDLYNRYQRLVRLRDPRAPASLPLALFLAPGGDLIHASGYRPPESAGVDKGFLDLARAVDSLWSAEADEIEREARAETGYFAAILQRNLSATDAETSGLVRAVYERSLAAFNSRYPGFGSSRGPRFPEFPRLEFLIEESAATGDPRGASIARACVLAMREGAFFDPLEGGAHRYCAGAAWSQTRFEKLLATQAAAIAALARLQKVSPDPAFDELLRGTWDFTQDRLADGAPGAFAAGIAAAPPGAPPENFWGWTPEQLRALLPENQAQLAGLLWGIELPPLPRPGETPAPAAAPAALRGARTLEEAARALPRIAPAQLALWQGEIRARLLEARGARQPAPPLDTRLFTAPNARLSEALWLYSEACQDPGARDAARAILDRFRREALRPDGLMAHRIPCAEDLAEKEESTGAASYFYGPPFLEDQTAWGAALLAAHEATGDPAPLREAGEHMRRVLQRFRSGSLPTLTDRPDIKDVKYMNIIYYDKINTGPATLTLPVYEDGESPGAVSEAALLLARLWLATDDPFWRDEALWLLRAPAAVVRPAPGAYSTWARALARLENPERACILGPPPDSDPRAAALLRAARAALNPRLAIVVYAPGSAPPSFTAGLPGSAEFPLAWVERGGRREFARTPEELAALLRR